jgi:hypothetical protein
MDPTRIDRRVLNSYALFSSGDIGLIGLAVMVCVSPGTFL